MEFLHGQIEQIICDAINIIVDTKIQRANYNKVMSGTVISDNLKGTSTIRKVNGRTQVKRYSDTEDMYKIQYQKSTFIAYPIVQGQTYSKGDNVLILVLNNDMANEKYILRRRPTNLKGDVL